MLEGGNAYWCDTCKKTCRATKPLSITRTPTILMIHLKQLILGEKMQTHTTFGTTLDLGPYMTLRPPQPQCTQLIRIISHHGTKDNGHYTAITKRGENWTLFNNSDATHVSTQQVLLTQAYILVYRNPASDSRAEMKETEPRDRPLQQGTKLQAQEDLNPRPAKRRNRESPILKAGSSTQDPRGRPLPRQERREQGTNPVSREGSLKENKLEPDTQLNPHTDTLPVPEPHDRTLRRQPTQGTGKKN